MCGGAELLARARDALVERGGGRRLVLCVDDGQLLDEASAALTHQLMAAGEAFALVTLYRGEPRPDALRALWKDELCMLVELNELSRVEAEQLLAAALGGPVDGAGSCSAWRACIPPWPSAWCPSSPIPSGCAAGRPASSHGRAQVRQETGVLSGAC